MNKSATKPYRTNIRDVPCVGGLKREDGWVDMKVQFLIDEATAGSTRLLVGWTVIPPGGSHELHRHHNADEFRIILSGSGVVYSEDGEEPCGEGDVVFRPAGCWHGFKNTSDEDVVIVWGWGGAGSLEAAGYETPPAAG